MYCALQNQAGLCNTAVLCIKALIGHVNNSLVERLFSCCQEQCYRACELLLARDATELLVCCISAVEPGFIYFIMYCALQNQAGLCNTAVLCIKAIRSELCAHWWEKMHCNECTILLPNEQVDAVRTSMNLDTGRPKCQNILICMPILSSWVQRRNSTCDIGLNKTRSCICRVQNTLAVWGYLSLGTYI